MNSVKKLLEKKRQQLDSLYDSDFSNDEIGEGRYQEREKCLFEFIAEIQDLIMSSEKKIKKVTNFKPGISDK